MVIRGVVFDVDDTLYDERDYVRSGFACVSESIAARDDEARVLQAWLMHAFESGDRRHMFDRLIEAFPRLRERANVAELVERYRRHAPDISLERDTVQVLDTLVERDLRLAVLSDGHPDSQHAKVVALRLGRWFDPIVLTGSLGPSFAKPSTLGFESIARQWGIDGVSLCYVADNPEKDFAGPRALGWATLRIRHRRQLRFALEASGPAFASDSEIGALRDLVDHLML